MFIYLIKDNGHADAIAWFKRREGER